MAAKKCRGWAATALCLALLTGSGCSRYPVVSRGEHVELIAALRTACSSKRIDRLDKAAKVIEDRHTAGELTDDEHAAFMEIVKKARAGQWKEAEVATFEFQQAQVR